MYIVFLIGIHPGFARGLGWRGRRMFHPGFARGLGWRGRRMYPGFARGLGWRGRRMYPGFARGLGWRGRRMKGGQPLAPATARLFIAGTSPPAVPEYSQRRISLLSHQHHHLLKGGNLF